MTFREPRASAVSWMIATNCSASHALDYYSVFHEAILASSYHPVVFDSADFFKMEIDFLKVFADTLNLPMPAVEGKELKELIFERLRAETDSESKMLTLPAQHKEVEKPRCLAEVELPENRDRLERAMTVEERVRRLVLGPKK